MGSLQPLSGDTLQIIREFEQQVLSCPQVQIETQHVFHAGMYSRTIFLPAGTVLTGAFIVIPTILILSGDIVVYGQEGSRRFTGYNVLCGSSDRKQVGYAIGDSYATMIFPTKATTIEEAEEEFTDEAAGLMSRKPENPNVVVIGGPQCLVG